MTPKEKANKLRYQIESAMQDADMRGHYNQAVKECVLIVVDEIINTLKDYSIENPMYELQVKQEIEKL